MSLLQPHFRPKFQPKLRPQSQPKSRTQLQPKLRLVLLGIAVLLALPLVFLGGQSKPTAPAPSPLPSPNAPNPNYPPGLQGPEQKTPDQKAVDRQNQVQLLNDIDKLYALAFELREQMKVVDPNSTMSVTVVKRAQAIEKLAKEIKDRAKR